MHIKDVISQELDISDEFIRSTLDLARRHVKIFQIQKRNGKPRTIHQPSKKTKTLQYWLLINIYEKLPVHDKAIAYRKSLSILDNAKFHRSNKYFLRVDLKNFFPSIRYADLMPIIMIWHKAEAPCWKLDKYAKEMIRLTCFYTGDILPIGYPTSPTISNAVMYKFDVKMIELISNKDKYGEVAYTRYADDLVFSTNKRGACKQLLKGISGYISKSRSPKLEINSLKVKFGSSKGGTASVTGLKIRSDGSITIHRNQKDHIRLMLSLYRKGALNVGEYQHLLGHLSYIYHVDPGFYSKIQRKYYLEIAVIRNTVM